MPGAIAGFIISTFSITSTIGVALVNIGVGLAFSAITNRIFGQNVPQAEAQRQQLAAPNVLMPYRYVYGVTDATLSPLPHPVIGDVGYGVYLLNSRPSALIGETFTLKLYGRVIELEGDPYDFEGEGAKPTSGTYADTGTFLGTTGILRVWIGLGDQTAPPDVYLDECPFDDVDQPLGFKATDAGQGLTVVYLRYHAGPSESQRERWSTLPPAATINGLSTKVWDMRDEGQDSADEDTWLPKANHGLCALDVIRKNPFRPYADKYVIFDHYEALADVADESVPLASGGNEPRYEINGTVVFDGDELEDVMGPIMEAGAAELVRVGGKLGAAPGIYLESSLTLTTIVEGFRFSNMAPGDELPTQMRTKYVSKARGYTSAELLPWDIPGAALLDGEHKPRTQDLIYTTSPTCAMRLRSIAGRDAREQRQITGILPPEATDLVTRSGVDVAFGGAFVDRVDGAYEVRSMHPAAFPLGDDGGIAMRIPATLRGRSPATHAWSIEDEEEVYDPPYDFDRGGVAPPGALSVTTGDAVNRYTGGATIPRIRFATDPSASAGLTFYEWQARETTGGTYGELTGSIPITTVDGGGQVFGFVETEAGVLHDIRLRAWAGSSASDWVEITAVQSVVSIDLDLPTNGAASETSPGEIEASFRVPNDPDAIGLEIFAGPTTDPDDAASFGVVFAAPNATVTETETGLGSLVTRYYFARTRGAFASASDFTAPIAETTS